VYNFPVCENPRHSCVHKSKAVRNAIRAAGARRLFLPAYSPDLNPIEQVFAKLNTDVKSRRENRRRNMATRRRIARA
jgi:transposase